MSSQHFDIPKAIDDVLGALQRKEPALGQHESRQRCAKNAENDDADDDLRQRESGTTPWAR